MHTKNKTNKERKRRPNGKQKKKTKTKTEEEKFQNEFSDDNLTREIKTKQQRTSHSLRTETHTGYVFVIFW